MTRAHRRDKGVKNASIIAGLRCEPALALRLTGRALEGQRDDRGRADVAAMARYLLRMGVGWGHARAGADVLCPSVTIPGLRVEHDLVTAVDKWSDQLGLGRAGTIRHLLRLQLGFTESASLAAEARFTEIAEARRALMETQ